MYESNIKLELMERRYMRKIAPVVGGLIGMWAVIMVGMIWTLEQHALDVVYFLF